LVFENDDDDNEALTTFFFLFDEDDVDESRELLLGVFFVILFVLFLFDELNVICDARVVASIDSLSLFFSLSPRNCSRAGERKNEEKKCFLVNETRHNNWNHENFLKTLRAWSLN